MSKGAEVLGDLDRACPAGARPGEGGDAVDGVRPRFVVSPRSTAEVAAAVRAARSHGLSLVARGAGTKLDWGAPPRACDLVVDLSGMSHIIEHESGDFVARVEAGAKLARMVTAFAPKGQWFPVDEVVPGSTAGGVVATALSGPCRYLHGPVRDHVLGATFVRADGVVARTGSKVVKNVAGYDLAKLLTGSYGTLGLFTELTLRLRPLPQARHYVLASLGGTRDLASALRGALSSPALPSAVEVAQLSAEGPLHLCLLVEGRAGPARRRAGEVRDLLPAADISETPPPWWGQLPGPVTVKMTSALSAVPAVIEGASAIADQLGLGAAMTGSAGAGIVFAGLSASVTPPALSSFLAGVREVCRGAGGHAVLVRAGTALKQAVDVWGPVPGIDLMRRVKDNFDPQRALAPGRFVGGI